jgi:hypothetical protein
VVKEVHCTFSVGSKDSGERDTTASLDDLVTRIDPGSNDLLKRRHFRANRLTALYVTMGQHVPFFPHPLDLPVHWYSVPH